MQNHLAPVKAVLQTLLVQATHFYMCDLSEHEL